MIRDCLPCDAASVADIYNHYVENTVTTFEEHRVPEEDMAQRIESVTTRLPWLVWQEHDAILGYTYATAWKARAAYRFAVESTIYLAPGAGGHGIGTLLYQALIEELRRRNMHAVVGGIALPNPASVALHEKIGFEKIAQFREIGRKFDRWIDVGYWQLLL